MEHDLKVLREFYPEILRKAKTFEIRKDDRDFMVGDTLLLREIDSVGYTGRACRRKINFILADAGKYGLKKGYVILAIG